MEHATPSYLACEQRLTYALLMVSAGMMGASTSTLRGGVFCNKKTGCTDAIT